MKFDVLTNKIEVVGRVKALTGYKLTPLIGFELTALIGYNTETTIYIRRSKY